MFCRRTNWRRRGNPGVFELWFQGTNESSIQYEKCLFHLIHFARTYFSTIIDKSRVSHKLNDIFRPHVHRDQPEMRYRLCVCENPSAQLISNQQLISASISSGPLRSRNYWYTERWLLIYALMSYPDKKFPNGLKVDAKRGGASGHHDTGDGTPRNR